MKILYWTPLYWPDIGGTQTLAKITLRALAERGHEILVLTTRTSQKMPEAAQHEGIPIQRMPFWSALNGKDMRLVLRLQAQVAALKLQFLPDLIHIDFSGYTAFFQVATAKKAPAPTVLEFHNDVTGFQTRTDTTLRRLLEQADWVTGVSKSTLESVQTAMPSIIDRSSVVYACAPTWEAARFGPPSENPVVLGIGRLDREKGFDVLIAAAARLAGAFPGLQVRIVGDGPERAALEAQADGLGLRGIVVFSGSIPNENLPKYLAEARVVVVPSRYREPFGLVAVEAAALARPVVASNMGGLAEVVVHGETGLLVEMENPQALATAIAQVLADPVGARKMGLAAQRRAGQEFSLAKRVDAHEALYHRLTARRPDAI
ncbi:MAG TPA: glycosyltransferase family 4 protein [Anaerolineae bacterium]|nr:glycosyltransferase family 4 protein [Anaerolineae bacterium]